MAAEFFRSDAPGDVAIKITPSDKGRLEVYLDGEKIFDRKEAGAFPDLSKVNELKMVIAEKLYELEEA
ncbi:MAG: Rdx family protein [Chloroflexi bacterium]|nr:Rdx family protein [Chloroflexota bacterium]MCI0789411.1 Rdx family protein [Chloroflexota bacterium]MCI0811819.1 Rdx family protein [Chloroflexota bacterium]MCI0829358.1 Rdx family protein [Chloroflexota bacterium]MCI0847672.1 Rdx family protein [Chloroflexota bacterium]